MVTERVVWVCGKRLERCKGKMGEGGIRTRKEKWTGVAGGVREGDIEKRA